MHRFGYSGIKGDIPQDIMELIVAINGIRHSDSIHRMEYPNDYLSMESVSKLTSVKYSNAIGGIIASDERILEIVFHGTAPDGRSEEEIAGYRDALNQIRFEPDSLDFDRDSVFELYSLMNMGKSDSRVYRDGDGDVTLVGPDGTGHVILSTVPADEIDYCMEQLFKSYRSLYDRGCEPLLYIPCIILDFLCIDPLPDGNEKASRLLTELMLYKEGIDVCRYISIDEYIYFNITEYRDCLREFSEGWQDNSGSYFPFIRYFLRALLECYTVLDTRFVMLESRRKGKFQTVEDILSKTDNAMTLEEVEDALPNISSYLLKKSLKTMIAQGKVKKVGNTKGTRYKLNHR